MGITDPPTPEVQAWIAANVDTTPPLTDAQLDRAAARLRNARDRQARAEPAGAPEDAGTDSGAE